MSAAGVDQGGDQSSRGFFSTSEMSPRSVALNLVQMHPFCPNSSIPVNELVVVVCTGIDLRMPMGTRE